MKLCGKSTLLVLIVACLWLPACASRQAAPAKAPEAVAQPRPFGGVAPVPIPSEARAMADFLKAQVAASYNDRAEALRDYEATVNADPHNAVLRVKLATLYVRQSRLKNALDQVKQAIALDPKLIEARLLEAGISSAMGDNALAEQQYEEVLRLDPKNQEACLYLGTLYAKHGKYEEALKTFQRLSALDPHSFLGFYYAGRVMATAKKYKEAERYYEKLLSEYQASPRIADYMLALARSLAAQGKTGIATSRRPADDQQTTTFKK